MNQLAPYAKAIVAGLSVTIAAAIPLAGNGLTPVECLVLAGAFLGGAFPTWAVPNRAAPGKPVNLDRVRRLIGR